MKNDKKKKSKQIEKEIKAKLIVNIDVLLKKTDKVSADKVKKTIKNAASEIAKKFVKNLKKNKKAPQAKKVAKKPVKKVVAKKFKKRVIRKAPSKRGKQNNAAPAIRNNSELMLDKI